MFNFTNHNTYKSSRLIGGRNVALLEERRAGLKSRLLTDAKPRRGCLSSPSRAVVRMAVVISLLMLVPTAILAQNPPPNPEAPKKANSRPAEKAQAKPDPFDGASV